MNTQWRLDSKAPSVANDLRRATLEQRRRAALAACEAVVPVVGIQDEDDVRAALRDLREAGPHDPALRTRVTALSERFDDEYFRLNEEGDDAKKPDVLRRFAKARAVSALAFALSDDPSQFHEVIYEAMSALIDNPSEVARAVEAALRENPQN